MDVRVIILVVLLTMSPCALSGTMNSVSVDGYELTYYVGGDDDVNFCEANHACVTMGANLVKIDQKIIEDAIVDLMKQWGYRETWIGGTDMYAEGNWKWLDNTPLIDGYTHWAWGEPNNYRNEDCLNIQTPDTLWHDHPCDLYKGFICQKKIKSVLPVDHLHLTLSETSETFVDARQACLDMGMRLVEIKDTRTFEIVQRKLGKENGNQYWIGGDAVFEENKWKFKEGIEGNPNIAQRDNCLTISYDGWLSVGCAQAKHRFMCESITPHALQVSSEDLFTSESESVQIDCSAKGFPLPDVAWYKDDELITDKTDQRIHQSIGSATSTLVINNVQLVDGGKYKCFAINYANGTKGMTQGSTILRVLPHGEPLPANANSKAKQLEPTEAKRDNDDFDESECADYPDWILPVMIALISLIIIQFLFILYQRRQACRKESGDTQEFHNYTVYSVNEVRKA